MRRGAGFWWAGGYALVVLGVLVWAGHAVWVEQNVTPYTTSKKTQGGFKLDKVVDGALRNDPNAPEPSSAVTHPVRTVVWATPMPGSRRDAEPFKAVLIGEGDRRQQLGREDRCFEGRFSAVIRTGYGPEFVNSSIALYKGWKEVGRWKLAPLPEPQRLLGPKDRTPLSGRLGRFRVSVSPVRYPAMSEIADALDLNLRLDGKPDPEVDTRIEARLGRTTWGPAPEWAAPILYSADRKTDYGQAWWTPFAKDMDWVEAVVRLEETKSFAETVRIDGFSLMMMPADKKHSRDWLKVLLDPAQAKGVTPSGIHYALNVDHCYLMGDSSEVMLDCIVEVTPVPDRVFLKDSPLCRATGKPVELSLSSRKLSGGGNGTGFSFVEHAVRRFSVPVRFVHPYPADGLRLPPVDFVFNQKAYVNEATFRVVAPVRDARTPGPLDGGFPGSSVVRYRLPKHPQALGRSGKQLGPLSTDH